MYAEVTSVYVPVKTPDYPVWAIVLSAIAHALVVGLLFFFYHNTPPAPMETSLITPEQLSAMQQQIKANQQNELAQNQATAGEMAGAPTPSLNSQTLSTVPMNTPHSTSTNQIETVKNTLAAKQAQWEKEQALFAEKLDREVAAERQSVIDELNQRNETQQRNLQDYKIAESNIDEVKNEIRANNAAYNKNLNANSERQSDNNIKSLDLGKDGQSTGAAQSQSSGGQSSSRRGGASGGSSAGYVSQVMAMIDANWNVPTNSNGNSLTASFSIAADGTISNITIRGSSDAAFKASLQQAINQSSPLPPPPNGARSMTGNFRAK
ncbi:protein TolA [Moraxella osloensis]|uniref:Protein TolA n=1 Tax=Faucicola osloensis TaxID=34062 RepID=A0A2D2E1Z7_FAUOS|nr:cell envelope integrity protein TolA [Moraxella osloensis]ATQ83292.1 protein TolA [Moraxella osloensis]ATQ85214.1 protein TolA [Moraxella osloensis]ATW85786.1 protein TolA [Moraxella osloensis]